MAHALAEIRDALAAFREAQFTLETCARNVQKEADARAASPASWGPQPQYVEMGGEYLIGWAETLKQSCQRVFELAQGGGADPLDLAFSPGTQVTSDALADFAQKAHKDADEVSVLFHHPALPSDMAPPLSRLAAHCATGRDWYGKVARTAARAEQAGRLKKTDHAEPNQTVEPTLHPAWRLLEALGGIQVVCDNAALFTEIAERRKRAQATQLHFLNAMGKAASDRADARMREGASFTEAIAELDALIDAAPSAPTPDLPAETIQLLRDVLKDGRECCENARESLRAGGAKGLDAATSPNAQGQPRSIEMHAKMQAVEGVFGGLAMGVGEPSIIIDNGAARMAELGAWFGRTRDELIAVIETRGLDAPPTVPASDPALLARLEAALALQAMETRDDPGIGGTDTDWKDVQGRLLAKRDRGEPYTSLRPLAEEMGCSDATIRKAIKDSDALKGWQARSTGPKAAPKATDLGAVVRDNTRQTTEPSPDDVLPDDEVDATMARLLDQAKPAERAELNALDDAGRRALVATYQSQNLDAEPSPLASDKPGERPRKAKQHKRA